MSAPKRQISPSREASAPVAKRTAPVTKGWLDKHKADEAPPAASGGAVPSKARPPGARNRERTPAPKRGGPTHDVDLEDSSEESETGAPPAAEVVPTPKAPGPVLPSENIPVGSAVSRKDRSPLKRHKSDDTREFSINMVQCG